MSGIRDFEVGDAQAVAELLNVLRRGVVTTEASLLHRNQDLAARARRETWVAEDDGAIVAFAFGEFRYWGGDAGVGRIWVGVLPEHRRRGIGNALYERAAAHAAAHDARRLSTEVDGDEDGARFALARRYEPSESEIASALVPAEADVSELAPLLERAESEGLRLTALAEVRDRRRDLYEFANEAGAWPPASDPYTQITFEDYARENLDAPQLDYHGSFVVLDRDDRIVSVALLAVDLERARAENDWTGTDPRLRGRGLARLVKLATIRWAAEHGIREVVTGNMADNAAMLAVNGSLGYREIFVRQDYERPA